MLFNQGISSQIRIVVKFNVMSEICFKNKKIFMKRSIIEITKDMFYFIMELNSNTVSIQQNRGNRT